MEGLLAVVSCIFTGGVCWGGFRQRLKSHEELDNVRFEAVHGKLRELAEGQKEMARDIKELPQAVKDLLTD